MRTGITQGNLDEDIPFIGTQKDLLTKSQFSFNNLKKLMPSISSNLDRKVSRDIYIRLLSTLLSANFISFYSSRMYACVLKVIRLWPWVFDFVGQGCSTLDQQRIYTFFWYNLLKRFGSKKIKKIFLTPLKKHSERTTFPFQYSFLL